MHKPDPPPPVPTTDPALDAQGAAANAANLAALQTTAEQDTASLMARYGTRLALANSVGGAPLGIAAAPMALPATGGAFGTVPTVNALFGGKAA